MEHSALETVLQAAIKRNFPTRKTVLPPLLAKRMPNGEIDGKQRKDPPKNAIEFLGVHLMLVEANRFRSDARSFINVYVQEGCSHKKCLPD